MAFSKTETSILNHRKFVDLDPAAIGLWTMGNAYCMDQLTDGVIPKAQVPRLIAAKPARAYALAARLVSARLWDDVDLQNFSVHDWLDWNPPAAQIRAERASARERMRVLRQSGRRSPERSPARSRERSPEHEARSPERSRLDVDVDKNTPQPPLERSPERKRPPEMFRTDCPDSRWIGRCVDPAYLLAHPEIRDYPARDANGTPRQCPAHVQTSAGHAS